MIEVQSNNMDQAITDMLAELETDTDFSPSAFWSEVGLKNVEMLRNSGIENFKRTLANNYYNWMIMNDEDPHFLHRWTFWKSRPNLFSLMARIEGDRSYQTYIQESPSVLSKKEARRYALFVSLGWDIARRHDHRGYMKGAQEPLLGNPIRVRRGLRIISQDIANSALECNILASLRSNAGQSFRVAEVGAGHGRLAHMFLTQKIGKFAIFDIPPALYVSEWYIRRLFPEANIFGFRRFSDWSEIEADVLRSDIAFFSANQIRKVPRHFFDVITSISTLPEMSMTQVQIYLSEFNRIARSHVFLKQWREWRNPLDGTELTMDDYAPGPDWRVTLDKIDPLNPFFFNRVWSRLDSD